MQIKQLIVPHKYRSKYGQAQSGQGVININSDSGSSSNIVLDNYITTTQFNNRFNNFENAYYNKDWIDSSINYIEGILKDFDGGDLTNYYNKQYIDEIINNIEQEISSAGKHVLLTEDEYDSLELKDESTVYLIKGSHYVTLTQAEYNALENPDEDKIYLIID